MREIVEDVQGTEPGCMICENVREVPWRFEYLRVRSPLSGDAGSSGAKSFPGGLTWVGVAFLLAPRHCLAEEHTVKDCGGAAPVLFEHMAL